MNIKLLLTHASTLKIAVIGDMIEDRYLLGSVDRISPEAPVPVVAKQIAFSRCGGAGNVFMNLVNLGVNTDLYCTYGKGDYPWPMEYNENIKTHEGSHAIKTRIMSGSHHLLRIDNEIDPMQIEWLPFKAYSWWNELEQKFGEYHCIVLSDYNKGVLSDSLINAIMELAIHYKIPVVVDAKKDYHRFKGSTIIKCNQKEYEATATWHTSISRWRVVTEGESGIMYTNGEGIRGRVNGHSVPIVDVCGAGDTVTAVISIMTALNEDVQDGCSLANIAAAEVCTHPGVHAISKEELIKRYNELNP
jgi:rfaE bifunctional protein kinase chain/domain